MMRYVFVFFTLVLFGCKSTTSLVEAPIVYEEELLDTLFVTAPKLDTEKEYMLERYQASYERNVDLLHTALDLKFDWENQHVIGTATLSFTPIFYPVNDFYLDAKGFDLHQLIESSSGKKINYTYDGQRIHLFLEKTLMKGEELTLIIDYTAKPNEKPEGGSSAITSDKGLFFINPQGTDLNKPRQIWTQGETEHNSNWFPTIDKPIERCTQEIKITVDTVFETLSNGVLVESTYNMDGTRTDYWKMDIPHAPYLFMLAIGDYAVVNDQWEDVPLYYYVEKEYEEDAKAIFAHTAEMMAFFSEYTGIAYPWPKYAQVVVRDYVSGAMENTTATVYGDFVQRSSRELIDDNNDYIVAHELFHHWFGDYVTCESWANLTMNEGFANYSEYLWTEHKYGKYKADYLRNNELRGYLNSTRTAGTHDLIHFAYNDKEDVFDSHSYNKGGLVLHMLRKYVGEDAFREILNVYLKDNALNAVEAHHLRLAAEKVTGKDLNWFFNQWFFDKGHPELEINHSYVDGTYSIQFEQKQDPNEHAPIFILPISVDFYLKDGSIKREQIEINERIQSFDFQVEDEPYFVNVDADNILLGTRKENHDLEKQIFQFHACKSFQDQFDAINALRGKMEARSVFVSALEHPFYIFRRTAVRELSAKDPEIKEAYITLALSDPNSQVRASALNGLIANPNEDLKPVIKEILEEERSFSVIASALNLLSEIDPDLALEQAETYIDEDSYDIVEQLADMFADSGKEKYLAFYEEKIKSLRGFNAYPLFGNYNVLLKKLPTENLLSAVSFLEGLATGEYSNFKRFMATNLINNIKQDAIFQKEKEKGNDFDIIITRSKDAIKKIKNKETNPQLLLRYEGY